jgi:hypothetical protein
MNTRSSKEYRYIFTTTWKQANTSHLSSSLTDNASGKLLIIFILSYLFVLPTSFLRIHKTYNRTSLQVWLANVLYFCSFCKPTFSGATREWDALYLLVQFHLHYKLKYIGVYYFPFVSIPLFLELVNHSLHLKTTSMRTFRIFSTFRLIKLHVLSQRANYTDQATAACRRS